MHGFWGSSPCTLEWAPPWALQVGNSLWELQVGSRPSRRQDHEAAHSGAHFRWKNLDVILLWEDEVLSLYS